MRKQGYQRYAKTLFKPKRPDHVDAILKEYGKKKVPYFFQFAKDKNTEQCEPINSSMINRISQSINNQSNMFSVINKLKKIDYLMMLPEKQDTYYNEEINKVFDRWNKKYGNNVKFNEDDDTNKNNVNLVALEIKKDLNDIEPDTDKVINSLVTFLYKKPSTRKKRLFWYLYGDKLYENISNNISTLKPNVCWKCGTRTVEDLRDHKCRKCWKSENKNNREKHSNTKKIKCIDCGKTTYVSIYNNKTVRCKECGTKDRKRKNASYKK